MKKLTMTLLTLLTCGTTYALPVGNPADPTLLRHGLCYRSKYQDPYACPLSWNCAWSFRAGFYGDYVFNRHMEVSNGTMPDVDDFEIYTNAALLAFNFSDRVDLFATLGASNFNLETNESTFLTPSGPAGTAGARFSLNTETSFSWSLGGRLTFWQCSCTSIGLEGQYFSTSPNVNLVDIRGFSAAQTNIQGHYYEWQLGLGIAHQIGHHLVPYFAIKWSESDAHFDNAIPSAGGTGAFTTGTYTLFNLENKKGWGYAVGATLIECARTSLTLEARFADEKAFHLNAQFRI